MRFHIICLAFVIILGSFAFSQESVRQQKFDELKQVNSQLKALREERKQVTNQQLDILLKMKAASEQDSTEAEKIGAKAIRLFPCCELEERVNDMDELLSSDIAFNIKAELGEPAKFSSYLILDFIRKPGSDNAIEGGAKTFEYSENSIKVISRTDHGLIIDIGKTPFESVNEQTKEAAALAEYQPPTDKENIKDQFVSNGIFFGQKATVTVGNTYILRAVKYSDMDRNLDGIFALKAHRIDKDGSLILFIKAIKMFDPPKLKDPEREEFFRVYNLGLVAKLKEELAAKGFKDVQVEVADKTITLKGSVPYGKVAEVINIAEGVTDGMKVKNELLEK